MIDLGTFWQRTCQGLHRRAFLRLGVAGLAGLTLPDLFRAEAVASPRRSRKEISCIFIYLAGGPSQLETFDPKPAAPTHVRGPWGSIPTRVPGTRFGELLPLLAGQADRFALIRSMHHTQSLHFPWPMLTGNAQQRISHGAAVTYLRRGAAPAEMPPYVHMGARLSVGPSTLGSAAAPLEVHDPTDARAALAEMTLRHDMDPGRLDDRTGLLHAVDGLRRLADGSDAVRAQDGLYRRALTALTSTRVRDAFDLAREPDDLRDRYGANTFGQSCLLARRLVEAGTRFVELCWYEREDGAFAGWDVHGDDEQGMERMEHFLCPRLDQGLSTLLDDLHGRGLLETTLVCATGEFGRTPTISRHGGRDHWPYCFSVLLAGAGVPGGAVVGASDARGAFPNAQPVTPADFAATLYRLLGVDPGQDDRIRGAVFEGHPIDGIC